MRNLSVLTSVVLMAACGDGGGGGSTADVSCAKSPSSCRCQTATFTLDRDESAAASCDVPPSAAMCCFDVDSSGETSACDCREYACYEEGSSCVCKVWRGFDTPPSGATKVANCAQRPVSAAGGARSCCSGGGGCRCQNHASSGTPYSCPTAWGVVSECPGAPEYFSGTCAGKTASSCKGLKWKK